MKHPIGFNTKIDTVPEPANATAPTLQPQVKPSVVRIYFPDRCAEYSYYNDLYDLKVGDLVYVSGKLEGLRGRITEVTHSFKIKLSDYQRVEYLVDTDVTGDFYLAGSHFVTFDKQALPFHKAITWFMPPEDSDDFVFGDDDDETDSFPLNDLGKMKVPSHIADRAFRYYEENRVAYLSISDGLGHAIVVGSRPYDLFFCFENGEIKGLTCPCYAGQGCKHQLAAMLQLKETLEILTEHYGYKEGNYFAAISKQAWLSTLFGQKTSGKIRLEGRK